MAPVYLSRTRIETGDWTASVSVDGSAQTLTIPGGTYYLDSDTAAESLRQAIADGLEALYPAKAFTVTWSTTTGKFTFAIDALATTWSLDCNQVEFAAWLGYRSTAKGWSASASLSRTSTDPCAGVIFADSERTNFEGFTRNYQVGSVSTQSGIVAQVSTGSIYRTSSWDHEFEPELYSSSPLASGVRYASIVDGTGGTATNVWRWEDFFDHHSAYHAGEPFKYFYSAGVTIDAFEDEYVLVDRSIKAFSPTMTEPSTTRYNRVSLSVAEYVTA